MHVFDSTILWQKEKIQTLEARVDLLLKLLDRQDFHVFCLMQEEIDQLKEERATILHNFERQSFELAYLQDITNHITRP